jgi:hypothetical protein
MPKCGFCENIIQQGLLVGFWGAEDKTKPICIKCLKKLLETDGNETGLKNRIEKWLEEEEISFNSIFEPNHLFHYTLKDIGPLKMNIELFQEKKKDELIVGFMTFLSNDLTFKIYKFTQKEKEEFKSKVDDFLATLRVDHRTGIRIGYEIISEKGHYGAKYFVKSKIHDCDKERLLDIFERVKDTGEKSDMFLSNTLSH